MSGGHATAGGIEYQGQVGAWIASHILTGEPLVELGSAIPRVLQMEAMSPVDDIVVQADNGGVWYINVKSFVNASTKIQSPLASVVDQFVRQWLEGVSVGGTDRAFDALKDRLVLVTKPSGRRSFARAASAVIKRISDGIDAEAAPPIYAEGEASAFEALEAQLKFHMEQHTGEVPDRNVLTSLISSIRLIEFEVAGPTAAAINTVLSRVVAEEDLLRAMPALVNGCIDFSRRRSGGDKETFRALLRGCKVQLLQPPTYEADFERLREMTRHALVDMSRYAMIHVAGSNQPIQLQRTCSEILLTAAGRAQSCLVIGDPGAGKSGALQVAAGKLIATGRVVLLIQVDQLVGTTLADLQGDFSLSHPLIDTLTEWRPDESPVLMIDALDASRGTGSELAVRSLISEVRKRAPHWTVIASIRKFDLRYGSQYHRLFEGAPVDDRFQDPEFPNVCHINVPKLRPDEILEIRSQWPALNRIAEISGPQFNALLSSPFNLFLLGRILRSDSSVASPAKTQLDLLEQFWRQRIEKDAFAAAEESAQVMDRLLRAMLRRRRLTAVNDDVPPSLLPGLGRLLHDGILYQPQATRVLSFAHHVLFDYALASLLLLRNEETFISEDLIEAAQDVLLVAPAIILALRMVWERHPTRDRFWHVSLSLAEDERLGSFLHSLPARVAAEAIASLQDVAGLIQAVQQKSEPGILLSKHLLSVVLAGVVPDVPKLGQSVDPWCKIVEQMASLALQELQWPLNAVIASWSEADLTDDQQASIGAAARLLLDSQLADEANYNEGSVSAAIQAVLRTYSSSPETSERLLRRLIDGARIVEYGHRELFWLASSFKLLAEANAQLAADFLCSAFSSPLPPRDEKTSLGNSRILRLTSNKRQDFEGILYQLQRHLPWFLEKDPEVAGGALRLLITSRVELERGNAESGGVGEAELLGRRLRFRMDHSCIWWAPEAGHHDANAKLLDVLCTRLREAAIPELGIFERVVLDGEVPAGLVAAFLRAATSRDDPGDIIQLLLSRDVLRMLDTSYDAAELAKRHYATLNEDQRVRFQDAIASIDDEHRKLILLACLPQDEQVLSEALRDFKPSNAEASATNHPHFRISSGWADSDGNSWLRDIGVDTEAPANAALLASVEKLNAKDLPNDKSEALKALASIWPGALDLVAVLDSDDLAHSMIRNKVLDTVADLALSICERADSESDLAAFNGIRRVIERCLAEDLTPLPIKDAKREESFADSPAWGRPAPRIPAAEALMCFIRASGHASEADVERVLKLARDPAVEIRHTILARSNLPCQAAPGLSEQLAKIAFTEEANIGVLTFFLGSFDNFMVQHLNWAPESILALESRLEGVFRERRGDMLSALVRMVLRLWVTWQVPSAKERLENWVSAPLDHRHQVGELLSCLRELLVLGEVEIANPKEDQVRQKGRNLFETLVENLAAIHRQLLDRMRSGEDVSQDLSDITQLLDSAAHHLYFGSGAYDLADGGGRLEASIGVPERHRFIQEYLPTLRRLAQIPYPSVTHPILQIIDAMVADSPELMLQLLFEAIRGGGQSGGYQFESLGADLVVKISRRFLADYSGLLTSKPEYRAGLADTLNLFASNGWPEPRKLVYQLPEMLR